MTKLLVRLFVKNADDPQNPAVRLAYGKLAGWVGILCNALLFGGKLLAGFLAGSISIMADAVNNLSDAASSVITLVGFKLSAKPADKEHPFGHGRFEYIAGLGVAVMVLVIGLELGISSARRILSPQPVDYSFASLLVLVASIVVKLWMALFNRGIGKKINSETLAATFADSRNDVITTAAVLAAALIARFTGLDLDGWMGLAVAVFILVSGVGLVRDTIGPLLGQAPDPALVGLLAEKIRGYSGVLDAHDLMVHDYGPGRRFASAHVEMDSTMDPLDSHDIIDQIERDVLRDDNIHLVLHQDPVDLVDRQRNQTLRAVQSVDPRLTLHDFRTERDTAGKRYIFDVVTPPDFETQPEELVRHIKQLVEKDGVRAEIRVDTSFAPVNH